MANVGEQLLTPEAGWKRYDDTNANISYIGSGWFDDTSYTPYEGTRKVNTATTQEYAIRFNFTGSKLRIIGILSTNWSNNVQISVDGITESFTQRGSVVSQILNYEKINLSNNEHSVVITNTGGGFWGLDAIDIDETGTLLPFNPVIPPVTGTECLLVVTLDEEVEREYTLTKAQLDVFVNWYITRSGGTGPAYYIFDKTFNRKDYLAFDKILTFEVTEFTK